MRVIDVFCLTKLPKKEYNMSWKKEETMEENIIGLIAKAEREAAAEKTRAQAEAAEIITEAEKRAVEIAKSSEETCKAYREKVLKAAQKYAQACYDRTIEKSRADAAQYAGDCLNRAEPFVNEILERVTK